MPPAPSRRPPAKDYKRLWEGVTNATDEAGAVRALSEIVADSPGRAFVLLLERGDAELCIETLDHGITATKLTSRQRSAFFLALRRLSERHELLPDRLMIEDIEVSNKVHASGGFGDVRYGTHMGRAVAVKSARVAVQDNLTKKRKRFYKEVILWETLSHPNVLKLVGVQVDIETRVFITVSEWMAHGNVTEYIRGNHANRLELLHGAAQGLKYLHGAGLIHGDLKGTNILMSNDTPPRACLADFGFITTALDPGQKLSCSAQLEGGTMEFMSPELLDPRRYGKEDSIPTTQADIYAFGLLIYQVLTGELPFRGLRVSELIFAVVQDGKRPEKPEKSREIGFSDSLWVFTQRCWDGKAELRPRVGEVVANLGEAVANWDGLMPPHVRVEDDVPDAPSNSEKFIGLFQSTSSDIPEGSIESQAAFEMYSGRGTPSTQFTDPPQRESQEVLARLFKRLHIEPRAPTPPQSERPHENPRVADDPPHHSPPPSQIPQTKQKGSKISKLRRLLGLGD